MREYREYTWIDEQELITLHGLGWSDRKIAKSLGASQTGVGKARHRLGLKPNFPPPMQGFERDPKQMYEDDKERSRTYKNEHPDEVKGQFAEWQGDHREQRTAYAFKWRTGRYIPIPFLPEFNEAITKGLKQCTTRSKCYGRVGDGVLLCSGRHQHKARLVEVVRLPFWIIWDYLWQPEGCKSRDEFYDIWCKIHPAYKKITNERLNERFWVHFWRLEEVDGHG